MRFWFLLHQCVTASIQSFGAGLSMNYMSQREFQFEVRAAINQAKFLVSPLPSWQMHSSRQTYLPYATLSRRPQQLTPFIPLLESKDAIGQPSGMNDDYASKAPDTWNTPTQSSRSRQASTTLGGLSGAVFTPTAEKNKGSQI